MCVCVYACVYVCLCIFSTRKPPGVFIRLFSKGRGYFFRFYLFQPWFHIAFDIAVKPLSSDHECSDFCLLIENMLPGEIQPFSFGISHSSRCLASAETHVAVLQAWLNAANGDFYISSQFSSIMSCSAFTDDSCHDHVFLTFHKRLEGYSYVEECVCVCVYWCVTQRVFEGMHR